MFYCNQCGTKNKWPTDALLRSTGTCEICGEVANCNDIRSSDLPLPEEVIDDEE